MPSTAKCYAIASLTFLLYAAGILFAIAPFAVHAGTHAILIDLAGIFTGGAILAGIGSLLARFIDT